MKLNMTNGLLVDLNQLTSLSGLPVPYSPTPFPLKEHLVNIEQNLSIL